MDNPFPQDAYRQEYFSNQILKNLYQNHPLLFHVHICHIEYKYMVYMLALMCLQQGQPVEIYATIKRMIIVQVIFVSF